MLFLGDHLRAAAGQIMHHIHDLTCEREGGIRPARAGEAGALPTPILPASAH
jgi:hypothetical protein